MNQLTLQVSTGLISQLWLSKRVCVCSGLVITDQSRDADRSKLLFSYSNSLAYDLCEHLYSGFCQYRYRIKISNTLLPSAIVWPNKSIFSKNHIWFMFG